MNLQTAINAISEFCQKWGFTINKSKTTYTVFCTAGWRSNYSRTYKLNLHIANTPIPLEPFPLFLGIKLDPKLSYTAHLEHVTTKIMNRINLLRKVKSLKLNIQEEICMTISIPRSYLYSTTLSYQSYPLPKKSPQNSRHFKTEPSKP